MLPSGDEQTSNGVLIMARVQRTWPCHCRWVGALRIVDEVGSVLPCPLQIKTLSVACHDLGQFIMHHPSGRYLVTDLRGKELVMRLMSHAEPEVQRQALLCVQKLMLSKDKLDFLKG